MKIKYILTIRLIFSLAIFIFLLPTVQSQTKSKGVKLQLSPDMVIMEEGVGDPGLMVDEQELSGDPLAGESGNPTSIWNSGSLASYPQIAYIDLGMEVEVTNVFIYDSYNVDDLIVESGEPGKWDYLFTEPLNNFKRWKQHSMRVKTRYLRISKTSSKVNFNEIVVYANLPVLPLPSIQDLETSEVTPNSILLTWRDVDGTTQTGNFNAYDLRYSQEPITNENFKGCEQFATGKTPSAPGALQSVVVSDLENGSQYYFALQLVGTKANSRMSNVPMDNTSVYLNEEEVKLEVDPSMITNESGMGDASLMFDEQELAGDLLTGNGGAPTTQWYPSNSYGDYPQSAFIDLGQEKFITKIFIRDINSVGDLIFEKGVPGNWEYLFTEPCTSYMRWKEHEVNTFSRYVRITIAHREAKFTEVVVYGIEPVYIEQIIPIDASMISNLTEYGDAWMLGDEQEIAGDPANSPGGNPVTLWQTGYQSYIPYPLHAVLDFGKTYQITKIFLRDSYSSSPFTIEAGTPDNWELITTDNLGGFLSWNQHDVDVVTRFLQFGKSSANANVNEIVLYGYDLTPGLIDSIPPATITDVVAYSQSGNDILLTWSAPGDDYNVGAAQQYTIKYGSTPITEENFSDCLSWESSPLPLEAGEQESLTISELNPDTEYYFAIQAVDDSYNLSEISNVAQTATSYQIGGDPYRFTIKPEWILNEIVQGDATNLVDEQDISGDPKNGQGGQPDNRWYLGSKSWYYPGNATIDLQGMCHLSDICLFDMDNSGADSLAPVTIYYGEPFNWQVLLVDDLQNSDAWNQHPVDVETRYLRVQFYNIETEMAEIVVYGTRLEEPVEEPPQQIQDTPTIDQMIGINAFIDDPIGRMRVAGFVREYHSWMWCDGNNTNGYAGYPNNENKFNTIGWNFDYYYKNLKESGIVACPAIQNSALWVTWDWSRLSQKPITDDEDSYDPASYTEHAGHMFQYAARYGNVQLHDTVLRLASGQHRYTGSNLLSYYENWNEQDKWWKGGNAFFDPYEYAAMSSADCDAHMGTIQGHVGLKNADPNAKLVMSGLAKPDIDYVKAIKQWSDYNRGGDFPLDVINVHNYSNDGTTQSNGNIGISPEEDNLRGLMAEFVEYRNRYLPGKEVWITEFGYDTHPESVQRAPAFGGFTQDEVQGQWLIRSYLALAAAGVDRAAMYMLRDVNETSSVKFNTSGLIRSGAMNAEPKPSWFYVNTMKNRLEGMRFEQEIESGDENVWIYKFRHTDQNVGAYAIWCPTGNATSVPDYELILDAAETKAIVVEMEDMKNFGVETDLIIENQKVVVSVSERPVFIIAGDDNYEFPVFKDVVKVALDASMVVNESGYGDATDMVDEQELSADPYMREKGEPVTIWSPGYSVSYPVSAYIDLGEEKEVAMVYLRDLNATGEVTVSVGEPGNWTPVFVEDLCRYKKWSGHTVDQSSRYVRFTKHSPNANFSEVVIYVRE